MKILLIDAQMCGLAFAMRCQEAGHSVRLWQPRSKHKGEPSPIGEGLVDRELGEKWQPLMPWADLIIVTDNTTYAADLKPYFDKGFPLLAANESAAALELDRERGQKAFEACGIDILPFVPFSKFDEAIKFLRTKGGSWVVKPWGGHADKALTYVPPHDYELEALLFKLESWKAAGLKGDFMLQERIEGIEMGVSGWFGPGGWSEAIEEDFEEKKFMNGGYGMNTGEQGTTLRFVKKSKLFDEMLKPMTEYFHALGYVGNVNVNCMIEPSGQAWPMEFTMRLGWPAFNIMLPLLEGDPAQWMLDLLQGKDTLRLRSDISLGVVMSHMDWPHGKVPEEQCCGFPIYGLSSENRENVHLQQAAQGRAPMRLGGTVKDCPCTVTAGDYVLVATGLGDTVRQARREAYKVVESLTWPSNVQVRTDIGLRLKDELPLLQKHGYAEGIEF